MHQLTTEGTCTCGFASHKVRSVRIHITHANKAWVGKSCTHDMGALTDCGDDATTSRGDGWPMCDRHAAFYDGLVKAAWEEITNREETTK